ncbi:hypothetical protein [Sanguibacter sp. Z1732]|uniref:hypothetical protein n=1 Tax=Sanguibacter sp. Z1732 TaxID=3435412 RepID=UPI003D9CB36B
MSTVELIAGTYNITLASLHHPEGHSWAQRREHAAQAVIRSGAAIVGLQEVSNLNNATTSQAQQLCDSINAATPGVSWQVTPGTRYNAIIHNNTLVERRSDPETWDLNVIHTRSGAQRAMTGAIFAHRPTGAEFVFVTAHFSTGTLESRIENAQIVADFLDARRDGHRHGIAALDTNGSHEIHGPDSDLWARGYPNTRQRSQAPVVRDEFNSFNGWDPEMDGRLNGRWIDAVVTDTGVDVPAAGLDADYADGTGLPLRTPLPSDHHMVWAALTWNTDDPGPAPGPTPPGPPLPAEVATLHDPGEFFTGELTTGNRLRHLPISAGSFSAVLNAPGTLEATIPLRRLPAPERAEIRAAVEGTRCYLAYQVGRRIVEAGPIWVHDYDDTTGDLRIRASGLWSLFDYRLVIPVLGPGQGPQSRQLSWTGLSLGAIAKRLVQAATAHTGGHLPIVLPPDQVGNHERTYPGFELATTRQRLTELTQVENGPDIAFTPRLREDGEGIEWALRTGTNSGPLLTQDGPDWVWDTTNPTGPVPACPSPPTSPAAPTTPSPWVRGTNKPYGWDHTKTQTSGTAATP